VGGFLPMADRAHLVTIANNPDGVCFDFVAGIRI
jgi:hypothetical protein